MEPTLTLLLVVIAFAAVQSVFGVGLLVFGTPSLLLLGFGFTEVLAYLLPASITISLMQVLTAGRRPQPIRRRLLLYTAPTVLVTSLLVVGTGAEFNVRPIVGGMLVLTALIRLVPAVREALSRFARRRLSGLLLALGVIHGASNLGGGLLTVIVSSAYEDKQAVRAHIAFGYLMMASLQLSTVVVTGWPAVDPATWAVLPVLAATTHVVLGGRLFRATGQVAYQRIITGLVGSFGLLLLVVPA